MPDMSKYLGHGARVYIGGVPVGEALSWTTPTILPEVKATLKGETMETATPKETVAGDKSDCRWYWLSAAAGTWEHADDCPRKPPEAGYERMRCVRASDCVPGCLTLGKEYWVKPGPGGGCGVWETDNGKYQMKDWLTGMWASWWLANRFEKEKDGAAAPAGGPCREVVDRSVPGVRAPRAVPCATCAVDVKPGEGYFRVGRAEVFCSRPCAKVFARREAEALGPGTMPCATCAKPVDEATGYADLGRPGLYCSKDCAEKAHAAPPPAPPALYTPTGTLPDGCAVVQCLHDYELGGLLTAGSWYVVKESGVGTAYQPLATAGGTPWPDHAVLPSRARFGPAAFIQDGTLTGKKAAKVLLTGEQAAALPPWTARHYELLKVGRWGDDFLLDVRGDDFAPVQAGVVMVLAHDEWFGLLVRKQRAKRLCHACDQDTPPADLYVQADGRGLCRGCLPKKA